MSVDAQLRVQQPRVARSARDRLFVAVAPDGDTAAAVHRLAGRLKRARQFAGRLIRPEHLHVSLFYLGSWDGLPDQIIAAAQAAAASVKMPPFAASFDRTASFWGRVGNHPFVLLGGDGVAGLKACRTALGAALEKAGLGRRAAADYTPHMTLLYDGRFAEESPIAPIRWTVRELVLVHSLYGKTTHSHLARWPLGAG